MITCLMKLKGDFILTNTDSLLLIIHKNGYLIYLQNKNTWYEKNMKSNKNGSSVVLLYNLNNTEKERKIKFVLIRMGIKIRTVSKSDYLQPIGVLAGIPTIKPIEELYTEDGFSDEMLVMKGFSEPLLDQMLIRFRKENIQKINLKAVITTTNQTWNSLELYKELKKEHELLSKE